MTVIPKIMRGIWLTGHGGSEMLEVRNDIPVPALGSSEVLIQVFAAAVNNTDINTRTAWYSKSDSDSEDASWSGEALSFPRIQGADVCGTIVAVGDKIDNGRLGERVLIEPCIRRANGHEFSQPWYFGSECDGGFAQYTVVDATHAYRVESDLSDVELASFPCSYSTAENLLTRASVKAGEQVLITGAFRWRWLRRPFNWQRHVGPMSLLSPVLPNLRPCLILGPIKRLAAATALLNTLALTALMWS